MPLYEYECDACGERFELIRKFSDPPVEVCTLCGKGPVNRLFSSPAIQFKGSGFYITDYAKKGEGGKGDGGKARGKVREDVHREDAGREVGCRCGRQSVRNRREDRHRREERRVRQKRLAGQVVRRLADDQRGLQEISCRRQSSDRAFRGSAGRARRVPAA